MTYGRIGDTPTTTVVWGDYIRLRAGAHGYVATGFTIGINGAEPFLVSFGRRPPGGDDESPQLPSQNPGH